MVMSGSLRDASGRLRSRLYALYGVLGVANLLAWGWAFLDFRHHPLLLGTALLAYTLGLRHAVDADHIAAIDNVTRKMMQEGKRPTAVGFFFSLGHSTVVVVLSLAIAVAADSLKHRFGALGDVGGMIGTGISAFFLFAIAAINLIVLIATTRTFLRVKAGERYVEEDVALLLAGRGMLSRGLGRLFRLIGRSWHMYPLGLLFGLGFDTASEVGLLGISAIQGAHGLSPWSIMVFPALFTAGMALVDTLDGTLMLAAYDWAFVKPMRKLYYNMTVTFVSVMVAVLIGGLEVTGLLVDRLDLQGPFWGTVAALDAHFGMVGFAIIGLFVASWVVSLVIYRIRRYDEIDVRT